MKTRKKINKYIRNVPSIGVRDWDTVIVIDDGVITTSRRVRKGREG